ncbi:MAG: tRNA guanosine(34) transglycosylase Tgt [Desulfovibrio sp.]|nr:tRNA guanosine(34) transglycosylase Tgt [Desulfovibrio sp.]
MESGSREVFAVTRRDGDARAGRLQTPHGPVKTPVFMPVGTAGSVKALGPDDLRKLGARIILGNTYHLYLRPGDELIARQGGIHRFCAWDRPILTDSGGFQAFSLSALSSFSEEGISFRSHLDGSRHLFTPEKALRIQQNLGSDIMMVLDECVPYGTPYAYTEKSVERTTRWAARTLAAFSPEGEKEKRPLLFAITQGGFFKDLRTRSVESLAGRPFDGFAVGGLSVGEGRQEMYELLAHTIPLLPEGKPRYLMGVGTPLDLVTGIGFGVDMFDCVLPTRNARNGTLFTSVGKISIKRREFAEDGGPLDPACPCYVCRTFSRAYLRHLFMNKEILALRLNSLHNLTYYRNLMDSARRAIREGTFAAFRARIAALYESISSVKRSI